MVGAAEGFKLLRIDGLDDSSLVGNVVSEGSSLENDGEVEGLFETGDRVGLSVAGALLFEL